MAGFHKAAGAASRRALATFLLSALLAACGGGGGGGGIVLPVGTTQLPATLIVNVPAAPQALGVPIPFASNASDPSAVLSYAWDFGDGETSSQARPTHAFARAGIFTVRLVLGNEAGNSLATTVSVAVSDLAIVAGKGCSGAAGTGWCWQRPLPQGNAIFDYAFVDDSRGWAVGEGGTLLATVDAGVSWNAQVSGTRLDLGRVHFVSAMVGWVAGSNGEVLKTLDGGASWQRLSYGQTEPAQTIRAADADNAWVTSTYGSAYVTRDGGSQWSRIVAPSGDFKLAMVSGTDVWALPYYNDGTARLAHSVDGGLAWTEVAMPPFEPGATSSPRDLQFADATHGLLVGTEFVFDPVAGADVTREGVWLTADRGVSWQPLTPPAGSMPGTTYKLVDATTVFASSDITPLQRTSDGGATWEPVPLPVVAGTFIAFYETFTAQRIVATDGLGRSYLTVDGGAHWALRGAGGAAAASVSSLWFFDSREGVALAYDGSTVRTSDGGQTWTAGIAAVAAGWRRAQFLADASLGWAIADSGAIHRSADKGRSWQAPPASTGALLSSVTDFHFFDAQRGWAVSPFGSAAGQTAFYASSDGGLSWESVGGAGILGGIVALRFGDALHGAAVGPIGIAMVTADGGATWSPRPTGINANLRRIAFASASIAVAVGENGAIVRSTDQGRTWTPVTSPTTRGLNDVRFVSASVGHASGEFGTVLTTRDGGQSWALSPAGLRTTLQAVFFVDEQTGWIAGDNGNILATANGGR
ncbi:MAG: YCF48-related protein [Caldimonas sp.]